LIYSEHTRVHGRLDCDWHRLLCPVLADERAQIVVCNYPVARQREGNGCAAPASARAGALSTPRP